MHTFIEIDKDLIPYEFDLLLRDFENNQALYSFIVNYNKLGDFYTFSLIRSGETLIEGEKLVLDQPLFKFYSEDKGLNLDRRFPKDVMIPVSLTSAISRVGINELNRSVYLFIIDRDVLAG